MVIRVLRVAIIRQRYFGIMIPAEAGSMGDQAMVQGCITFLKGQRKFEPKLYHTSGLDDWGAQLQGVAECDVQQVLRYPSIKHALAFLWSLRNVAEFGVIGADVMDGTYSEEAALSRLRLLTMAANCGVTGRLLGFSFYKCSSEKIMRAFRALPASVNLFVRDPISRERFMASTGRTAALVADLAFLLPPALTSRAAKDAAAWMIERKSHGKRIVAINANQHFRAFGWGDLDAAYASCISALVAADPDVCFLMLPHDHREGVDDLQSLQAIEARLLPELQARCYMINDRIGAADIKALLADVEMLVSGRMHAAIAALGQQTPVVCVVYVGKFEGLMQHVGLSGNLVSVDEAKNTEKLTEIVLECYKNRASMKARLQRSLPDVLELSRHNFQ